ncbi:MAG TPA: histidinol dehydrogenase [Candidatus Eisenbacteria bacterium]|nr:histidinol dehydrogenase [Candidatus Eisenbacteria bacterium]
MTGSQADVPADPRADVPADPRADALTESRAQLRLRRVRLGRDWRDADDPEVRALVQRSAVPDSRVRAGAREIIEAVRAGGEAAVRDANATYGGGLADGRLLVERDEMAAALDALPAELRSALEAAADRVMRFAEAQRPVDRSVETAPGVSIERRWVPLDAVGAYVPGGGAPYPSSLVMAAVPAQVAGVGRVVVATPARPDGRLDAVLLAAAALLHVDGLLVAGGAQAVAALAFGLPNVGLARVDRIVGPGNAWVTAAKLELAGEVGIDLPAGPSEGMVLALPPADPRIVAADLITQAEHGPDSPAILVTTDEAFADAVEAAVVAQLGQAARAGILERALRAHGRIVLVADIDEGIDVVNAYAPEHLSIDVPDLEAAAARIRNAGSVFVGPWAPESAGDYATGANHVLPTGGLARCTGALSVESFGKFLQVQRIDRDGLAALRPTIRALAEAEGLLAHRDAVEIRFETAGAR